MTKMTAIKTRLANTPGQKNIFTRILPAFEKRIDDFLEAEAASNGYGFKRTKSAFFREALTYYLDKYEKKYAKKES